MPTDSMVQGAPDRGAWSKRETLLFLATSLVGLWLAITMPVFSQEAYYWCYAQEPALSYFDHPPMVAWSIWLGCHLLGDGAIGVRLFTWAFSCGTCLLGLRLLREMLPQASERARLAWLVLQLAVPLLAMTHFLANPDAPLLFFWTASMLCLWRARTRHVGWWIAAGLAAGCALLSKYSAVFLAIAGVILLVTDPLMRRQLRRPGPYLGVVVAALAFLPVLIWNWNHELASFRFQTTDRLSHAHIGIHWFLQLLAGQILVLNPIIAVGIAVTGVWLARRTLSHERPAFWLLAFGLPLPLYLAVQALWVQVKVNWLLPGYIPLLLGVAVWWEQHRSITLRPWLRRVLFVSLAASGAIDIIAPAVRLLPGSTGSSWMGWEELAAKAEHWETIIDKKDAIEGNVFFFAPDYKDAAQLTRALKILTRDADPVEVLEPVLAQNTYGVRALQFDYWSKPSDHIGQDAILVLPRPEMRHEDLAKAHTCFEAVTLVDRVHVTRLGILVLDAEIYECSKYLGPRPPAAPR